MRCNNCGFENADEATHCIKCKTALDKVVKQSPAVAVKEVKEASYAGTILDSQLADRSMQQQNEASPAPEASASLVQCTYADCGYPYSGELKVCPRCQRPASATAKSFTGTIDPYRIKTPSETPTAPACYLRPVAKTGETAEEAPKMLSFTYEQSSIELNRDNLDPGNPSITGKTQAELSFEDGSWHLKDRSELQTTFLLASTQTPLKDGDIILLGDRKFIFCISIDK